MRGRIETFPVHLLYLSVFGFAGGGKLLAGGVPEWFTKQFGATILNPFPGGLALNFYLIAILETITFFVFAASLVRGDRKMLAFGFQLALLVFAMLAFGQMLTGQHDGAANLFFYFGATVVMLRHYAPSHAR